MILPSAEAADVQRTNRNYGELPEDWEFNWAIGEGQTAAGLMRESENR